MKNIIKMIVVGVMTFGLFGCAQTTQFLNDIQVYGNAPKAEKKKEKKEPKEEKKEEKAEEKVEEDTTVYEITVEELLNEPSKYDGKLVRVSGFLPADNFVDEAGNVVYGVCAEDGSSFVEITGVMPETRYCKAWVNGKAVLRDVEITIEATDYEVIEQYFYEESVFE